MASAFSQVGSRLVELGYAAIPIRPGSKIPGRFDGKDWWPMKGWSKHCCWLPTPEEVARWCAWPDPGVGLATGSASGIVAVDFDTRPEFWKALEAAIPKSPLSKRGEKGYTAFYQYNGEISKSFRYGSDEKPTVELLSVGRQTVIPPTVHPVTRVPYRWDNLEPFDVKQKNLPLLPADLVSRFNEILGIKERHERVPSSEYDHERPSPEFLEDMLKWISPEMGADEWTGIGSSIKSAYPDNVGLALWREWSARDRRVDASGHPQYQPEQLERRWRSLDPAKNSVTVGKIFYHAGQAGYQNWGFDNDRKLEHVSATLKSRTPEPREPLTTPPELIRRAPGLVGRIATWITETAMKPQPALSLGAALAVVGAVKGHVVCTDTDLRTNLYVLGIGGSGSGKNHPIVASRVLLHKISGTKLLGDIPVSEPGVYQMIKDVDARGVVLWDEIGHAVGAICNEKAPPHLKAIMAVLTEAFSSAASYLPGKRLANQQREPIIQPCLCIYGTTVPARFFDALTAEEIIDGFLGRWLIFEVETNWPEEQEVGILRNVPMDILVDLKYFYDQKKPPEGVSAGALSEIKPRVVPFSKKAAKLMKESRSHFRGLAKAADEGGEKSCPIWVRAAEHAAKIALTVSDGDEIEEEETAWALELVDCQCRKMIDQIDRRISENSQEKNVKKVLELIRVAGPRGVMRSNLTRNTQWLGKKERDSIIMTLVESEQISAETLKVEGATGPSPMKYTFL